MKKILPLLVVGILVLSGLGATAVTNIENNPPDAPEIYGPATGIVGLSYEFIFCTTDPDGDDVSYYIEWGDGTSTGWTLYLESGAYASFAYTWNKIDNYDIRCKAKDIHGSESDWSLRQIPIMKNKDINLQSSSTPRSQSEMSVIPSTGKTDIATSRTTFNDGTLSGYVNDTSTNPIEGALVRVYFHGTYEENYTDSSGYYHVTNIPICYCMKNCTASQLGYRTEWVLLSIDENTTHDFILMDNQPPSAPDIEGPTVKPASRPLPKVGEPWNYTFKSTDPDGDDVYYYIEWGDGTASGWIGPYASDEEVVVSHTWSEKGDFTISAKAKDIYGAESDWGYLKIIMPKNHQTQNMWFLRWLERLPLLQRLLGALGVV